MLPPSSLARQSKPTLVRIPVMLSDDDEDPHTVYAKLKKKRLSTHKRTASTSFRYFADKGWKETISIA